MASHHHHRRYSNESAGLSKSPYGSSPSNAVQSPLAQTRALNLAVPIVKEPIVEESTRPKSRPDQQAPYKSCPEADQLRRASLKVGSPREDSLDLNNVEINDDLSINRWLMRIMRLGESYTSTGSNGYSTATSSSSSPTSLAGMPSFSRRRMSLNVPEHSNLLKLPTATGWRARRLSDSCSYAGGSSVSPGSSPGSSGITAASMRVHRFRRGTFG